MKFPFEVRRSAPQRSSYSTTGDSTTGEKCRESRGRGAAKRPPSRAGQAVSPARGPACGTSRGFMFTCVRPGGREPEAGATLTPGGASAGRLCQRPPASPRTWCSRRPPASRGGTGPGSQPWPRRRVSQGSRRPGQRSPCAHQGLATCLALPTGQAGCRVVSLPRAPLLADTGLPMSDARLRCLPPSPRVACGSL